MKIALDAFGGDNAPDEVIKGAVLAVEKFGVNIILTGDEKIIKKRFSELKLSDKNIEIEDADGVIEIEDDPLTIRKEKINTSMGVALSLLKSGRADAAVSAGSTAALVVGGTMNIGRIKGIKRPALCPILPSVNGFYMLIDGGANLECRANMLEQFGIMGSIYMEKIMGIKNPRVGLLNVGSEEKKGRELEHEAYALLKKSSLNFIGNVEGRDPTLGACDVLVTDGFTGNVYLKTVEGMGKFMKTSLKEIFMANMGSKIGYLLSKKGVGELGKKMDYKEVGGSPLLGSSGAVIKAHGSSDAKAFMNSIRQAKDFVEKDVIKEIETALK